MDIAIWTGIYPYDGESVDELLKKTARDEEPIITCLFQTDPAARDLAGPLQTG